MMHLLVAALVIPSLFTVYTSCFTLQGRRPSVVYSREPPPRFGYHGSLGPDNWSSLDPENWAACENSPVQSPVNLNESLTPTTEQPVIHIPSVRSAPFLYQNFSLEVDMEGMGGVTQYEGKSYELLQFHFHTPSEHFFDGEYFPLEMHLVHSGTDDSKLVLGVLFDITKSSTTPLITGAIEHIDDIVHRDETTTGPLDFKELVEHFHTSPLFQYIGSLTTPPCTPGVKWIVSRKTMNVDLDSWQKLKGIMKYNARYIQDTRT